MKLVFSGKESEANFNSAIETVRNISPFIRNLVNRLLEDIEEEKDECIAKIWKDQLIGALRAIRALNWSGAALLDDECPISEGLEALIWSDIQ